MKLKNIRLLFITLSVVSGNMLAAPMPANSEKVSSDMPICNAQQPCSDLNNDCSCYCSEKCGPRKKMADDITVFVENDPNGIGCYCKQWDLDNYQKNCSVKE